MMKKILLLMMIAALVFSCKTKQPLTSTRALETVNVGAAPNDGTGDPLRTAFQKVNAAIEVMNDVSLDQATGSTGTGNLVFSASPTLTGTVTLPTATSIGDVSSTEIGYLDGVTSAIQTQVNGKLNISDTADMLDGYVRVVDIPAASGIYDWIDSANYYEQKINVIDYGADPTGTDYSDAAFASAFASMTDRSYLYVPPGLYKLTEKITIEDLSYIGIDVNGRLQFDANDSAFVFKNLRYAIIDINSIRGYGWMQVPDYSVRTSVGVTIYDCANSEFNINHIYGFGKGIELYSDRSGGIGNQYNRINFNYIGYCRYGIYFDGIAPQGYNNEIVITGGQIRGNAGLVMDGSTAYAWQNELHNIGFERLDSSGLILRSVRDLQVHNCRWENVDDILIDEDENCDYNRYYFGQTMYHSDLVHMHGLRSRIYGDILDDEGNDIYREMMKDSRDSAYYWTPRVPDARMLNRTVKYADDFDDIPDYLFEVKLKGNVKRYGRREDATLKLNVGSAPSTPEEGMIYGNSTDHHLYVYNGSTWVQLDNLDGATFTTDGTTYSLYDGATQLAPAIPASGQGELSDYVPLLVDTIPLFTFGLGGGLAADTIVFNDNVLAGAFYNEGSDTLVVTQLMGILAEGSGTETVSVQVSWHTTFKSDSATNLNADAFTITSITTGTADTSFANAKIPPNVFVWCTISGVSPGNRPSFLSVTISGYKIPTY